MTRLFRRLQWWLRRSRWDRDLAEEIEYHRAETERRLERSGLTPADAASASRRVLGNVTRAREDARGVWIRPWLESLCQDAAYAIRIVRRSPAFAASMIVVLALGIGATTGVFTLIDGLVLKSLPVSAPGRLVFFSKPAFSYPIFSEVQARGSHIFSGLFAWNMDRRSVGWLADLEPTDVLAASGEFYTTLGVRAIAGRTFDREDDRVGGGPNGLVAVISDACWARRFGRSPAVIGRTVRVERSLFTIVGVTPPGFYGMAAGLAPEITIPLTSLQDPGMLQSPTTSAFHLMGRVRDGLTIPEANAALQSIWPSVVAVTTGPGDPPDRRALYLGRTTSLEPARNGYSRIRNQFEAPLWLLFGLVGLLLLVASASAANLLLARGVARRREIAVRLALGASRPRLVRQLLTEALIWTTLGGAAGLLLASWSSGALIALMSTAQNPIVLDLRPGARVLAFTLCLALFTTVVCAVLPGLRATRLDPNAALKARGPAEGSWLRGWSLGKALVVLQVAFTVLLLVGAALFVRSLQLVLGQDAGFDRQGLLVVTTDPVAAGYRGDRLTSFHTSLLDRLGALPGVESASLSWYPPISDEMGSWTQSIGIDGGPVAPKGQYVYFNAVSPDYFRTVGMRLLSGRPFARADTLTSPKVVIVNDSLARAAFGSTDAVGRRISIGRNKSRQDLQIVGIVSDAKYQRLQEAPRSIAYLPCAQLSEMVAGINLVAEVRVAGPVPLVADRVKRELRAVASDVPARLETIADRIDASLVKERVLAILALLLGGAALTLACAGLYGLLSYVVSRHTPELGLRLALGANRGIVFWMVVRQCLGLTALGTIAGLGAAIALGRFARTLLFQITAIDPLSLAGASVVMLTVALGAAVIPARRAVRVDPVTALRSE